MPEAASQDTSNQYAPETMRGRLEEVRGRVERACDRAGRRSEEITLIAVSKTHPPEAIQALYEEGVRAFGASYVQEWEDKADQVPGDIEWHFVGHLQSNKARDVVDRVAYVHSVDRRSVMKQLNKRTESTVDVLLQVNIAGQDSKSGVLPDELADLIDTADDYPNLNIRGLMTLPPHPDDPEDNRDYFRRMRDLFDDAAARLEASEQHSTDGFDHLSMGMTNDFEVAIEEGATMIRLGTALFGPRHYD
jgi:hypothetical protein